MDWWSPDISDYRISLQNQIVYIQFSSKIMHMQKLLYVKWIILHSGYACRWINYLCLDCKLRYLYLLSRLETGSNWLTDLLLLLSVVFPTFPNFAIGLDFTTDGKYMALAERRNCKDCISIFACTSWQLVKVQILNIFRIPYHGNYLLDLLQDSWELISASSK